MASQGIARSEMLGEDPSRTLQDCQQMCEVRSSCMAVDFYAESGWCNIYEDACTTPLRSEQGSSSYALKRGAGVAAILVFFVNLSDNESQPGMAALERTIRQLPRLRGGIEKYVDS